MDIQKLYEDFKKYVDSMSESDIKQSIYDAIIHSSNSDVLEEKERTIMLNKETLSKQKYIYTVYISKDGVIHSEKFPVIYINKTYVYYKTPEKENLTYRYIAEVYDSLEKFPEEKIYSLYDNYCPRTFFWNIKDAPKTLKEFREKYNKAKYEKTKEEEKQKVEQAKKLYEATLAQYEKMYGEN